MGVGTSLGKNFDDLFHFHQNQYDPKTFPHNEIIKPKDTGDDNVVPPDEGSYDNKAKILQISNNSGFHLSDNIDDRRNEFYDPRTDPRSNDLQGGAWYSKDNPVSIEPTPLSKAAGSSDLDIEQNKYVNDIDALADK